MREPIPEQSDSWKKHTPILRLDIDYASLGEQTIATNKTTLDQLIELRKPHNTEILIFNEGAEHTLFYLEQELPDILLSHAFVEALRQKNREILEALLLLESHGTEGFSHDDILVLQRDMTYSILSLFQMVTNNATELKSNPDRHMYDMLIELYSWMGDYQHLQDGVDEFSFANHQSLDLFVQPHAITSTERQELYDIYGGKEQFWEASADHDIWLDGTLRVFVRDSPDTKRLNIAYRASLGTTRNQHSAQAVYDRGSRLQHKIHSDFSIRLDIDPNSPSGLSLDIGRDTAEKTTILREADAAGRVFGTVSTYGSHTDTFSPDMIEQLPVFLSFIRSRLYKSFVDQQTRWDEAEKRRASGKFNPNITYTYGPLQDDRKDSTAV